jgi:hypothetical protein
MASPGLARGNNGQYARCYRPAAEFCACDGLPMEGHDRCKRCGILIGPLHLSSSVNERGVCEACEMFSQRDYGRWDAPYV